jgi:hypothetical protein
VKEPGNRAAPVIARGRAHLVDHVRVASGDHDEAVGLGADVLPHAQLPQHAFLTRIVEERRDPNPGRLDPARLARDRDERVAFEVLAFRRLVCDQQLAAPF